MANLVPKVSEKSPGIQLNKPATKKAVLMESSCPCDKFKLCLRAELYKPKAYEVPPVVAEAKKAQTKLGMLERGGRVDDDDDDDE